jgi:pSer/pThr/pTyr-binding forkhead associated (FHA) protein
MTSSTEGVVYARLTLVRGTGKPGSSFELGAGTAVVGTAGADLVIEGDPTVSPLHAAFRFDEDGLWVEDLDSHNGTFIRVRKAVRMEPGSSFLAGEEHLKVVQFPTSEPTSDGQRFCGTPMAPWKLGVVQVLQGGFEGALYSTARRTLTVGREDADASFPFDPYMSGRHCKVSEKDGELYLVDLESRNGTFYRLPSSTPAGLEPGDYLFIGRQLFRVDAA